jgi:hypothetical protein
MAHSTASQALARQVLFLRPLAGLGLRLWMYDQPSAGNTCMTFEGGLRTSCVGALMAHLDYLMTRPYAPA